MATIRSEKKVQADIVKYLKTVDGLYFNKHSDRYVKGIPDILGCYKGCFFAIEVKKSEGGKIAPMQQWHAERITKAGGKHIFATNVQQVVDFITSM